MLSMVEDDDRDKGDREEGGVSYETMHLVTKSEELEISNLRQYLLEFQLIRSRS